ncbi:hypothetical protein BC939DRAFT_475948 [Gamsiella multidivaricata]|uniref:uncharacterized protein n=1 Tax=Gamsiella multidivaricata TaxID=101098 RepID=UPI00221F1371|nr:uncharacterized protein BC939DRAFT_475948 [Gamsiella multidivaricata]KAI7825996.1 hypothetical protein BC939DRAFT_475948 [Gamsiella multidivaricata]
MTELELSRSLLVMKRKPGESHQAYGKRIERVVKNTSTADKTPATAANLSTTVSWTTLSFLRIWRNQRQIMKHLNISPPKEDLDSVREFIAGLNYFKGPGPEDNNSQATSNTLRLPSTQQGALSRSNRRSFAHTGNSYGFKRVKTEATESVASALSATLKCAYCKHLSNHTTEQCKTPLCSSCNQRHYPKHCPINLEKSRPSPIKAKNFAMRMETTLQSDDPFEGDLDMEAFPPFLELCYPCG